MKIVDGQLIFTAAERRAYRQLRARRAATYARIKDPKLKEHWVYWAYDGNGRTLYIGCTKNLKNRWYWHRCYSAWPPLAVSYKVLGPFNFRTARRLERMAQIHDDPLFGRTPLNHPWRRPDEVAA